MTFNPSKRKFLRNSLGTAAAAATLASFPPSIRRALAIEANNATGTIQDVKHVVLLMLENRAFDSYFGTFRGVRGYGDRFDSAGQRQERLLPDRRRQHHHAVSPRCDAGNARAGGTPHTWPDAQAAWDHGRMNRWPTPRTAVDGLLRHRGSAVPARAGRRVHVVRRLSLLDAHRHDPEPPVLLDRHQRPQRRQRGGPINEFNGGNDVGPRPRLDVETYADRLVDAGVSWKVYQSLPTTSAATR
jgi:phospholipase C